MSYAVTCPALLEVVAAGQSNINPYFFPDGENGFDATIAASCPSTTIHFTDCAVSGTPISDWQPSGTYMEACFSATSGVIPNVVIWYQGESDSATLCTPNYDALLTNTLNEFEDRYPGTLISYAQISIISDPAYSCQASIRAQQASIETATWPMITTLDLTRRDFVHLDAASEYVVGQRFATEILGLLSANSDVEIQFQGGSGNITTTGSAGTLTIN